MCLGTIEMEITYPLQVQQLYVIVKKYWKKRIQLPEGKKKS